MCHKLPWLSTTAPRQGHTTAPRQGHDTGTTRARHGHDTAGGGHDTTTQQDAGRTRARHTAGSGARCTDTQQGQGHRHTAGAGARHTAGTDTQQEQEHRHTAGAGAGTHSRSRSRDTQQVQEHRHTGETISPRGPKPPVLSRTRQHGTRATIPGSCFVAVTARTMARAGGIGIRRRVEAWRERAVAISSLTNFVNSVSLEKEDINAKNKGHPLWCRGNCRARSRGRAGPAPRRSRPSQNLPSLLRPLRLCSPVLVAWLEWLVSSQGRLVERQAGTARAKANSVRCFFAASRAAASLCHAMNAEASAGGQWTSGGRTVRATVLCRRLEHPVDLKEYRVQTFESADSALVEVSCDRHPDPWQASEMTTIVKRKDTPLRGAIRSWIPRGESSDLLVSPSCTPHWCVECVASGQCRPVAAALSLLIRRRKPRCTSQIPVIQCFVPLREENYEAKEGDRSLFISPVVMTTSGCFSARWFMRISSVSTEQ